MPGAGSLAKCQCCCVDRLCSRGENRGVPPQLDGAVRHETCRTAFSCRRAKSRRSYRAAARLSKNLVAFAPAGAKKVQSFSSATCAAKKILLRLQVWNLCAGGAQIMRAADCTPLVKKPPLRSERRLWRISVRSIGVRLHRAAHERQQRRQQQRKHDRLRRADAQTQRQRAEDEHGRIVPVDEAVDIQ